MDRESIKTGIFKKYKYIHLQKNDSPISFLMFLVQHGAKNDPEDKAGLAHFLEHMIFKSTKKRSTKKISFDIEMLGGITNAFTSYEYTGYHITMPVENFSNGFEVLSDIFQNGLFLEREVEIEKGNIIEEIRMIKDDPASYISEIAQQNLYYGTGVGRSILGTEETVGSITSVDLKDLINNSYPQDDILVVSAGNFNEELTLKNIEKYLSERKTKTLNRPADEKFQPKEKIVYHGRDDLQQAHVIISFKADGYKDENYNYKLLLLESILGVGLGSILFRLLREKLGVAYYVYADASQYRNAGDLSIFFGANQKKTNFVVEKILEELEKLKTRGITKKELRRAQNLIYSSFVVKNENLPSIAKTISINYLLKGKIITLQEFKENVYRVQSEEIQELSNQIFGQDFYVAYAANDKIIQ